MAKRKRSGKRRVRGVSGRFQKRRAKKQSGHIPTDVLLKRYKKLGKVIKSRKRGWSGFGKGGAFDV